jgi:hypothetical protein
MKQPPNLYRRDDKWKSDDSYRYAVMGLAEAKKQLLAGLKHRPQTMLAAFRFLSNLDEYISHDYELDYSEHFVQAAEFLHIPAHELRIMAAIGQLIMAHVMTKDDEPEDAATYWENFDTTKAWTTICDMIPAVQSEDQLEEISKLEKSLEM